jgi:hypothetical protein
VIVTKLADDLVLLRNLLHVRRATELDEQISDTARRE